MNDTTAFSASNLERKNRVSRLIDLIDGANESIRLSKEVGSALLIKQYEHLKKKYVEELKDLLAEMNVLIEIKEAA